MKRLLSTLLLLIAPHVNAQFVAGQVLGAAQLNAALASPTITSGSINGAPIGQSNPKAVNATSVGVVGASSGTVSILPQSAAGTYNFNLPTTAGASGSVLTSGGGSSTPMTWTPQASLAVGSATVATQASTVLKSDNVSYYPMMGSAASSTSQGFNVSSGLSFNPTVGLNVTGALSTTGLASFGTVNKLYAFESGATNYFTTAANGVGQGLFANSTQAGLVVSGGAVATATASNLSLSVPLDLSGGVTNTYNSGATKWSYFSGPSNIYFTGSTGFYVNDQANTKNLLTVLDAAPNNALVVGTTGTSVKGLLSSEAENSLQIRSGSAATRTYMSLGRAGTDALIAVAGTDGGVIAGSAAGDLELAADSGSLRMSFGNNRASPQAVLSSTGLAVTGALSVAGGDNADYNGLTIKSGVADGNKKAILWTDAGGTTLGRQYLTYSTGTTAASMVWGSLYNAGANSTNLMTLSPTGLAVTGALSATGLINTDAGVLVDLDGSDTPGLGALVAFRNTAHTRQWINQLSASNNKDWWYYNGSLWDKKMTLDTNGNLLVGTATPLARLTSVQQDDLYSLALTGATTGMRVYHHALGTTIQGVDSTLGASYQPITLGGSTVTLDGIIGSVTLRAASSDVLFIEPGKTRVADGSTLQVGSGAGTSAGLIAGYHGTSGYGAIWPTSITPGLSNYTLLSSAAVAGVNASSSVGLHINDVPKFLTQSTLNTSSNPLSVTDTTDSSSTTTGSLKTAGGLGVAKKAYFGERVELNQNDSNTVLTNGSPTMYLSNQAATNGMWNRIYSADSVGGAAASILGFQITDTTNNYGNFVIWTRGSKDSDIRFTVTENGDIQYEKTITAPGTTGAQTINKTTGRVNFAAAATSLVVTNSLVATTSIIQCTVATNDTTMKSVACVPGSGSFTIHANAAPTAETAVAFTVTN